MKRLTAALALVVGLLTLGFATTSALGAGSSATSQATPAKVVTAPQGVMALDTQSPQTSTSTTTTQPSTTTTTTQPSTTTTTTQPSTTTTTTQPSTTTTTTQPTTSTTTTQPSTSTTSTSVIPSTSTRPTESTTSTSVLPSESTRPDIPTAVEAGIGGPPAGSAGSSHLLSAIGILGGLALTAGGAFALSRRRGQYEA